MIAAHAQSVDSNAVSTDQALTPAILGPIHSDPIRSDPTDSIGELGGACAFFTLCQLLGMELLGGGATETQISVKICIRNRISARCVCRQFGRSVAKFG